MEICIELLCYIILCICFFITLSDTTGEVFLFDDSRFVIGVPVFLFLFLLLYSYRLLQRSIFAIEKVNGLFTFHSILKKYSVRMDDIIQIKDKRERIEVNIAKGNRYFRLFMPKNMGFYKHLFTVEEVRSFISNTSKE